MPGPPPKRDAQRRRHNTPAAGPAEQVPVDGVVAAPPPRRGWHPVAKAWYESLGRSGQARYYEPSDWATATLIAESISRELKPQPVKVGETVEMVECPPKGASMAAWLRGMTSLMVTEGDRRRARVEFLRGSDGEEEGADVSELDEYRTRLRRSV